MENPDEPQEKNHYGENSDDKMQFICRVCFWNRTAEAPDEGKDSGKGKCWADWVNNGYAGRTTREKLGPPSK
ncbi:hypothetical protein PG993_005805 [Apiospora rasikravindrae]|uniref:Uncharacterized protein n=1 Tax=Apiospora rasikravindrae TaxID=990691 RepID=A0ABR1T9V2_9PEZI